MYSTYLNSVFNLELILLYIHLLMYYYLTETFNFLSTYCKCLTQMFLFNKITQMTILMSYAIIYVHIFCQQIISFNRYCDELRESDNNDVLCYIMHEQITGTVNFILIDIDNLPTYISSFRYLYIFKLVFFL